MPFDLAAVQPDVVVAAAYKWLLGPYSIGFMHVAPRWQGGKPIEHSWFTREGSEKFGELIRYRDTYQRGARRYDVGEPSNFALMPAAVAALGQLVAWGPANISATLGGLTRDLVRRAAPLGFTSVDDAIRAPHYPGLRRMVAYRKLGTSGNRSLSRPAAPRSVSPLICTTTARTSINSRPR
jgi:hypothetical protein